MPTLTRFAAAFVLLALVVLAGCQEAASTDVAAQRLADRVMQASGAPDWPRVKTLAFTLRVSEGGKPVLVRHHLWDVKAGTDTVTAADPATAAPVPAAGGSTAQPVTVDLARADLNDPAQAGAYHAWRADTARLLAPLKLGEPGVRLGHKGEAVIAGRAYEVLDVTVPVGEGRPDMQYTLYVDPLVDVVAHADSPNVDPKAPGAERSTWLRYQHFGPLKLSTVRQSEGRTVTFENVVVEAQ